MNTDFTCNSGMTKLMKYNGHEKNVKVPEGIVNVESESFYRNDDVEKIVFPSSVKKIEKDAICCCQNLKEVVFENPDTTFGFNLFPVSSTKNVKLFENFRSCTSLEKITGSSRYVLKDNCILEGNKLLYVIPCKKINIPSDAATTGDGVFRNCVDAEAIEIGNPKFKLSPYGCFQAPEFIYFYFYERFFDEDEAQYEKKANKLPAFYEHEGFKQKPENHIQRSENHLVLNGKELFDLYKKILLLEKVIEITDIGFNRIEESKKISVTCTSSNFEISIVSEMDAVSVTDDFKSLTMCREMFDYMVCRSRGTENLKLFRDKECSYFEIEESQYKCFERRSSELNLAKIRSENYEKWFSFEKGSDKEVLKYLLYWTERDRSKKVSFKLEDSKLAISNDKFNCVMNADFEKSCSVNLGIRNALRVFYLSKIFSSGENTTTIFKSERNVLKYECDSGKYSVLFLLNSN